MFGGPGWTWVRAQGALREAADKVAEGGQFFTRGIRLLGSDVNSAAVLFYRAAAGASLKPREARTVPALGEHALQLPSATGRAFWL